MVYSQIIIGEAKVIRFWQASQFARPQLLGVELQFNNISFLVIAFHVPILNRPYLFTIADAQRVTNHHFQAIVNCFQLSC